VLAPSGWGWAATVIGVIITDPRAVIDALADPETLYVFGVVAARTSKLGLPANERAGTTPYVTRSDAGDLAVAGCG
jgi:hypothetical protein